MAKRASYKLYQEYLTEDGLKKIESWSRDGLSMEQMAHNIGIHPETWRKWRDRYPEMQQAVDTGQRPLNFEVENQLLKKCFGFEHAEEQAVKDKDGDITVKRVMKYYPPDTTALIFWLKNKKPDIWGDVYRQQVQIENAEDIAEKQERYQSYFEELTDEEE